MAAQLIRTWTGTSQKEQEPHDNINRGQAPLTRTTTTNTQTGVLNHLTEAQELKLDEFKERLQKDGWWSPDAVNGKPTHGDGTLLYAPTPYTPATETLRLTPFPDDTLELESSTLKAPLVSSPTRRNG